LGRSSRPSDAPLKVQLNEPWVTLAKCRGLPKELFVGYDGEPYPFQVQREFRAKQVCNGAPACPVREECLAHAVAAKEYGVWGGMDATERNRIRRQQQRSRQGGP
jgi:WhiB family transcriptional regulator, redox-sensing transcriptional regulator